VELQRCFPQTHFAAVVDDADVAKAIAVGAHAAGATVELLLDLDCGMHRTGIEPGPRARELYRFLATTPGLKAGGLHCYDGHLHDKELADRTRRVEEAFVPVEAFRAELQRAGLPVPRFIASGTPTFPVHARRGTEDCSPGTCVFWDAGYAAKCPDLDFLPAALVFTRIISKPSGNRLTLDLGHKAIAAENPHPRVIFLNLPDARAVMHSEEHLVLETPRAAEFAAGDALYGVPWHICPTVNLHGYANVVRAGHAVEQWRVSGRERILTV
jgi:D-serine deaminase-like pyridoxal phosphate-dependent protein